MLIELLHMTRDQKTLLHFTQMPSATFLSESVRKNYVIGEK